MEKQGKKLKELKETEGWGKEGTGKKGRVLRRIDSKQQRT